MLMREELDFLRSLTRCQHMTAVTHKCSPCQADRLHTELHDCDVICHPKSQATESALHGMNRACESIHKLAYVGARIALFPRLAMSCRLR
jgi:hypothetical protein